MDTGEHQNSSSDAAVSEENKTTINTNSAEAFVPPSNKRKVGKPRKDVNKEQILEMLHLPQQEAASRLGVSVSTLKRRYQEFFNTKNRWPSPSQRVALVSSKRVSGVIEQNALMPSSSSSTSSSGSSSPASSQSAPSPTPPSPQRHHQQNNSGTNPHTPVQQLQGGPTQISFQQSHQPLGSIHSSSTSAHHLSSSSLSSASTAATTTISSGTIHQQTNNEHQQLSPSSWRGVASAFAGFQKNHGGPFSQVSVEESATMVDDSSSMNSRSSNSGVFGMPKQHYQQHQQQIGFPTPSPQLDRRNGSSISSVGAPLEILRPSVENNNFQQQQLQHQPHQPSPPLQQFQFPSQPFQQNVIPQIQQLSPQQNHHQPQQSLSPIQGNASSPSMTVPPSITSFQIINGTRNSSSWQQNLQRFPQQQQHSPIIPSPTQHSQHLSSEFSNSAAVFGSSPAAPSNHLSPPSLFSATITAASPPSPTSATTSNKMRLSYVLNKDIKDTKSLSPNTLRHLELLFKSSPASLPPLYEIETSADLMSTSPTSAKTARQLMLLFKIV